MGESFQYTRSVPVGEEYDVLVAGAGPSGILAALGAARMGKKVCLLDQNGSLGGIGTNGLISVFMGMTDGANVLVGNTVRELVARLEQAGGRGPDVAKDNLNGAYDVETLKLVYDGMVREAGIGLKLFTKLVDADVEQGLITGVLVSCGEGLRFLKSKLFVDASGDAVLSSLAGVPCEAGDREGNTQAPTLGAYYAGVDWDRYKEFLAGTGQGGSLDKTRRKAYADHAFTVNDYHLPGAWRAGEHVAAINAGHVFGADVLTSGGLTDAVVEGRKLAREYLAFYRAYVPGFENAALVGTGSILGVRESRRVVGEYVLSGDDFLARRSFPDEIGRFHYPADVHESSASLENHEKFMADFSRNYRYTVPGESYGIPFRSLIPKKVGNLLVAGRCLSADRRMQASVRVMPGCFLTGNAAGTATAMCVSGHVLPRELNTDSLRAELKSQGVYLP